MSLKTLSDTPKLISIVVPCFNEEEVISETVSQLINFCNSLDHLSFELIFVDDGSKDHTRQLLKKYAAQDNRIKIICFSRNFGHQIAVTAGIDATSGNAVSTIWSNILSKGVRNSSLSIAGN